MNTLRVCFCCGVLLLATSASSAPTSEHNLVPVADGAIFDTSPFDGIGDADGIVHDFGVAVILTSLMIDSRGVVEFDLTQVRRGKRIQSATLRLTVVGGRLLPGVIVPFQVMGYRGDGTLQVDDFNQGTFLTVYDASAFPFPSVIEIDVTNFTRLLHRRHEQYVGFSFRTNVDGFQQTYGSLDRGPPINLVIVQ